MPRISVMTFVFSELVQQGKFTEVEMLQALETTGLDGLELSADLFIGNPARLRAYKSYLSGSGMEVSCIDGLSNLVAANRAERQREIDKLRVSIDLADAFHTPIVLAAGSRLSGTTTPEDGRKMIIDALATCMTHAQGADITLAIEDFGMDPALQCSARDCIEVLDAVPDLAFVFDTGNFYLCGEDPLDNFAALAPRTCHVHVKDWVKSDTPQIADVSGAFIDEGLIPNRELIRRFRSSTSLESYALEMGAPGEPLEVLRRELASLRRWLDEA